MLSLHYIGEDQIVSANRESSKNIWNVIISDALTGNEVRCQWSDIELAASMALAISGGFDTNRGVEKEEHIDKYLYNIAETVASLRNNLRIIPSITGV